MKLNNKQRTACLKHAGTARFAYNWGLQRKNQVHAMNQLPVPHIKNPTAIDLHKELVILKKTDYPWMYEASKCPPQEALRNLDMAFKNFFGKRTGYPNFKTKRKGVGSFRLTGIIKIFDDAIQLPKLGRLRLKERGYLPTGGIHILSATVSEQAGRWFVSVQVEEEIEVPDNEGPVVGVDLGIKGLATISDEEESIENPRSLSRFERKLKRQQRKVSRRKKGSNNRRRSVKRLQKIHARIANIRKDNIHKVTTMLARTKSVIGIEDLNVSGMMKNHKLAKAIGDVGMGMFRRQLEYKSKWYGSKVVVADRWFPSSKRCSGCHHIKKDLKLSERVYHCDKCGLTLDRDANASGNLKQFAASSAENTNACLRGEVSGLHNRTNIRCPPMIQESDHDLSRSGDGFV